MISTLKFGLVLLVIVVLSACGSKNKDKKGEGPIIKGPVKEASVKAKDMDVSTGENIPLSIVLVAVDDEGDSLTYTLKTPPANGTLEGTPPEVIYSPSPLFAGKDTFTFFASDQDSDSNVATVTIDVTPLPPVSLSKFDGFPVNILSEESTTLTWEVNNAVEVMITPDIGKVSETGSIVVQPSETTTYELSAKNAQSEVTEKITIEVSQIIKAKPRAFPATGYAPLTVLLSPDIETISAVELYEWDMDGDGIFERSDTVGKNQSFTYREPGQYPIALRVTDIEGRSHTGNVNVTAQNQAPEVNVSVSVTNGHIPLRATFYASVSDNEGIESISWDFDGDGEEDENSSYSGSKSYVYDTAGSYQAIIKVTDTLGAETRVSAPNIEIRAVPVNDPTVQMYLSPASGYAPLTVSMNAQANVPGGESIINWQWDFDGDGEVDLSGAQTPEYTYTRAGTFYPSVTVTTSDNKTATDVKELKVEAVRTLSITTGSTINSDKNETATIATMFSGDETVSLVIEDKNSTVIRTIVGWQDRAAGTYEDIWDGKGNNGLPVAEGEYYAVVLYGDQNNPERLDLRASSSRRQYNPPRTSIPRTFSPFDNQPLVIDFTLNKPAEVTAFMGLFNTNVRLITFFERRVFGTGTHSVIWNGEAEDGQLVPPPEGESFLFGIWAYELADNTIFVNNAPTITEFSISPSILNPISQSGSADNKSRISFTLNKASGITLKVTDMDTGTDIAKREFPNKDAGEVEISWDGKNNNDELVAPGKYRVGVQAADDNGSKSMIRFGIQRIYY